MPEKSPPYAPKARPPAPFPTRGTPGGWRDPWDSDPLPRLLAPPSSRVQRRSVRDVELHVELIAHIRQDGRWLASVVAGEVPPLASRSAGLPAHQRTSMWPSANGASAIAALDALEAELREEIVGGRSGGNPAV